MKNVTARLTGMFWILGAICTTFSLYYVSGAFVVAGDPLATVNNIRGHELLFRIGLVSDLLARLLTFGFGIAAFILFREISRTWSMVLVVATSIVATLGVVNSFHAVAVLLLLSGSNYLAAFEPQQLDGLGVLFLKLQANGQVVLEIFWLPYLFSFGMLLFMARVVPRVFGIGLMAGSFGFPIVAFAKLLAPEAGFPEMALMLTQLLAAPSLLISNFWLLINGTSSKK